VTENNRSYFMRRAAQERSAADRASDQAARAAHLELARRYRALVSGPGVAPAAVPATGRASI
jgi:hypothetical protein